MIGFGAILRKECVEMLRTWRLFTLPGLFLFFAVTSPLLGRYTKELVQSMVGKQADMMPPIPDPTYLDSYAQWVKNVGQLGVLAIVIVFGGMIAAERRSGTAVLALTKPVGRSGFVLAKFAAASIQIAVILLTTTVIEYGLTRALFTSAQAGPLLKATLMWFIAVEMIVAVVLVASAVFSSSLAASGVGLGAVFVLTILGLWGPAFRYSPAGVFGLVNAFAAGQNPPWAWPVLTTVGTTAALVSVSCWVFRRQEL